MIASTFWKNPIQGAIACDQLTRFDSSSCSRKLPAVCKNFLGMMGARRRPSASGQPRPVSGALPPRSKSVRMSGASSSTTASPRTSPTTVSPPTSNVASRTEPMLRERGAQPISHPTDLVAAPARRALPFVSGMPRHVLRHGGIARIDMHVEMRDVVADDGAVHPLRVPPRTDPPPAPPAAAPAPAPAHPAPRPPPPAGGAGPAGRGGGGGGREARAPGGGG